jgi:hypothetical protein
VTAGGRDDPPAGIRRARERWTQLAILGVGMVLAMSPSFAAAAVAPILRDEWTVGLLDLPFLTVVVQLGSRSARSGSQ